MKSSQNVPTVLFSDGFLLGFSCHVVLIMSNSSCFMQRPHACRRLQASPGGKHTYDTAQPGPRAADFSSPAVILSSLLWNQASYSRTCFSAAHCLHTSIQKTFRRNSENTFFFILGVSIVMILASPPLKKNLEPLDVI